MIPDIFRKRILGLKCIPIEIEGKVIALQPKVESFKKFKETYPEYKIVSYTDEKRVHTVFVLEKDKVGTLLCDESFEFFIELEKIFPILEGQQDLKTIDLSYVNTSNIYNMDRLFSDVQWLETLDLSYFNTSKAESMCEMFAECQNLKALDLSNFDTSNVTDMREMFKDCDKLKALDLSSFDTSKVEDMNGMFNGCRNLKTLDLSNFDTRNVINISGMFDGCVRLKTVIINKEKNPKIIKELQNLDHEVEIVEPAQKDTNTVTISNAFS